MVGGVVYPCFTDEEMEVQQGGDLPARGVRDKSNRIGISWLPMNSKMWEHSSWQDLRLREGQACSGLIASVHFHSAH